MVDTKELLSKLEDWWKQDVYGSHKKNVKKLRRASEFSINPFIHPYIANFVYGDVSPLSLSKALILPRMMSTSVTTTFGKKMQDFIVTNIDHAQGSGISGIDIEFYDQTSDDDKRMYCQVKAGPNTINSGDVGKIAEKFKNLRNKARLDGLQVDTDAPIVGVLYGNREELSGNYKAIESEHAYGVFIGSEFWEKLTGDSEFYNNMAVKLHEISMGINEKSYIDNIIKELSESKEIIRLSNASNNTDDA